MLFRSLMLASLLAGPTVAFACGGEKAAAVDISEAPGTHLVLQVEGMTCDSCAGKIQTAISALEGVNAVAVNHETGKAEIAYDAAKLEEKTLISTIEGLDFKAKKPSV